MLHFPQFAIMNLTLVFYWSCVAVAIGQELNSSQLLTISDSQTQQHRLTAGQTLEISARVVRPSQLPDNARIRVSWSLVAADNPQRVPRGEDSDQTSNPDVDVFGIYTQPTANWSKWLHALDPDVYVVYRAPVFGVYELRIMQEEEDVELFHGPRWREDGHVAQYNPVPKRVHWPDGETVEVATFIRSVDIGSSSATDLVVETEPNDTPEQAQPIRFCDSHEDHVLNVVGTSDDIEYFDNGRVGASGDDWFRIEYTGSEIRLLTACLSIPDQQVAARIRAYWIDPEKSATDRNTALFGQRLSIDEYEQGKNANERTHQQTEEHRTAINRTLEPGGVYFLRVEANSPAYDLEIRVVKPAPYDDPGTAIRHGLYDHLGQVDAWLTNRPRGASVERRIRDSGNLLGTNCMSCHTQSGVWGPAVPFAMGYRPRNIQAWRHLVNTCYQSMRPTNHLVNAANNTSLKPLDIGDGPAGTRVAGHAVVALERFQPPRRLQSKQAIRAANHVLQTGDPGGINAAGPGANVGEGVVFNYTGEVLAAAWMQTGNPDYLRGLEDKAKRMLDIHLKYSDDLSHRVEFFERFFWPTFSRQDKEGHGLRENSSTVRVASYLDTIASQVEEEQLEDDQKKQRMEKARALAERIQNQTVEDLERLRAIQLEDGGWSFDPGSRSTEQEGWSVKDTKADPSPTALALLAFEAAGVAKEDPLVAKGIVALLAMQHPTGYWNGASKTGFVSTSYALHALSRYFPVEPPELTEDDFRPVEKESLSQTIRRVRQLSTTESSECIPWMVEAAAHASPLVRYWAMIGLGMTRSDDAVESLVEGLGDPTKVVREAAHWGLRQLLIDDRGWDEVLAAVTDGEDTMREAAIRTLIMKVDGVLPGISVDWERLALVFDNALNDDPHPAVRAWATRAAWQWWIWNAPIRPALNSAWSRLMTRAEPNALVENTIRYQSHALLIANGHVANASDEHQYLELRDLVEEMHASLKNSHDQDQSVHRRLTGRLVAIAATYYNQRGGDGGAGQMGYSTPGAGELFGDAVMSQLAYVETLATGQLRENLSSITLEGAANIPHEMLQNKLVDYALNGPEQLRRLAASSISDPRLVRLPAVAEQLEPMHRQLLRGAAEPPRRKDLSDPILKMFGSVSWILPESSQQRKEILSYLIPVLSSWRSEQDLNDLTDAVAKQEAEQETAAAWYLAQGMGTVIQSNPDLHFEEMAESFPETLDNDAIANFWIRNVPWILTLDRALPEVKVDPNAVPPADPYEALRTRAVQSFLFQLEPDAFSENRQIAVDLANKTELRRNPEILTALEKLLTFEKDEKVLEGINKVLSQQRGEFESQLAEAVASGPNFQFPAEEDGTAKLPDDFVADITYFRDYVVPEMTKVLRGDERSCMICHGEPGRVPSMELHAPDRVGFLPVDQLLANYHALQQRVNLKDVERSKLLRKPLNVQTGEEDGHQGGRRYQPSDPGYQIIRKWVLNQVELQKKYPF